MKKHKAREKKATEINLRPSVAAAGARALPGMRTCTECQGQFELIEMSAGKRICKTCQNFRQKESKERAKPEIPEFDIDLDDDQPALSFGPEAFEDRGSMNEMVKGNLNHSVNEANEMVWMQKARLRSAMAMRNAKLIGEASKDLLAAMEHRSQLNTKLMEKLQAMEDLRQKQEKAKPTTFYYNRYPKKPQLVPMRSMPAEVG